MPRFRALRLKYVSFRSSFNKAGFEKSIAKALFHLWSPIRFIFAGFAVNLRGPFKRLPMPLRDEFSSFLIESLRAAKKIVALTGAGISSESGLATFRDAQTGLWSKFRPEELATEEAFRRDPKFVQDWYAWRREQALNAQPNAGHLALAEMEKRATEFLLVTQNVDGLHARAGSQR